MHALRYRKWLILGGILFVLLLVFHFFSWETDFSFLHDDVLLYSIRLPRTLAAIFCGALLALSGLLLQILFSNILAGPSILGISSGASLGVALAVLLGIGAVGISTVAFLGAVGYSMVLLLISRYVKSTTSLLLAGIMLSSFTSAFIEILSVYAQETRLKFFTLWGMGSLQQVGGSALVIFSIVFLVVVAKVLWISRDLTVYAQGEDFAKNLGVPIFRLRWLIIIITSLAVAVCTAFCGPIAFIGIAIPNLVRLFFKTTNTILLAFGSMLFGATFLLLCDGLILALDEKLILPLNAMTALFGVPFIIWIIFKQVK